MFLYKAAVFGAFSPSQHEDIVELVQQFIRVLSQAATNESHIGFRYAKLLKKIWLSDVGHINQEENGNLEPQSYQNGLTATGGGLTNYAHGVQDYPMNPEIQPPVSMDMLTPDFNLFCPDFSSLESELFDYGAGNFGFPINYNH